jgi:hypothetical protein
MWWFWWFWAPIGAFARRVGECLGTRLARIAGEADYLVQRTRTASRPERAAWLVRCAIACLIVASECILLVLLRIRSGSPLALVVAWSAIILLPKPTPRIPLVVARMLAVVFTLTNSARLYDLMKARFPTVQNYGAFLGFCGFLIWIALFLWALSAFRISRHARLRPVSKPRSTLEDQVPPSARAGAIH